jgi:hypothetical protein
MSDSSESFFDGVGSEQSESEASFSSWSESSESGDGDQESEISESEASMSSRSESSESAVNYPSYDVWFVGFDPETCDFAQPGVDWPVFSAGATCHYEHGGKLLGAEIGGNLRPINTWINDNWVGTGGDIDGEISQYNIFYITPCGEGQTDSRPPLESREFYESLVAECSFCEGAPYRTASFAATWGPFTAGPTAFDTEEEALAHVNALVDGDKRCIGDEAGLSPNEIDRYNVTKNRVGRPGNPAQSYNLAIAFACYECGNQSSSSESFDDNCTGWFYLGRGPCNGYGILEQCIYVCKDDVPGATVGDFVELDEICFQIFGEYANRDDNPAFCLFEKIITPTTVVGPFASCAECVGESSSSSSFVPDIPSESSSSSFGYSESSSSSEPAGGGDPAPKDCSGDPDMILKVTADPGDFPITWCGETWTVGESGTEKRVCPSNHSLLTGTTNYYSQSWRHGAFGTADLQLRRNVRINGFPDPYWTHWMRLIGTLTDEQRGALQYTFTNTINNDLGIITGAPKPQVTDYRVGNSTSNTALNPWFNNHSVGTTNYAWRRGDNWPAP